MTLTDAGPLVALLNRGDQHHHACVAAARRLADAPMLTTWPCFTEAMYLLGELGGYRRQAALWQFRATGRLRVHDPTREETDRAAELMEKYRDTPMDLADATLVSTAESLGMRRIFTVDHHFRVYRLRDGKTLEMVPDPANG